MARPIEIGDAQKPRRLASLKGYWRLDPVSSATSGSATLSAPAELVWRVRPREGIVLASWDAEVQLGRVKALGIVRAVNMDLSGAEIEWRSADITLRPNPAGRRWWTQARPYFRFAKNVVERYMLDDLFAEHFPELGAIEFGSAPPRHSADARLTGYLTAGYVYVIRSRYGFKIGKTVNIRERTRLFSVKLPFPISLEHCARFDDYTEAERNFHQMFAAKRLEGEWFDLDDADLAHIRTFGQIVPVEGL